MTVVSDYRSLLSNESWDPARAGAAIVLTYSFSTAPTSTLAANSPAAAATFHTATASEQATVQAALAQWSAVSGITFVQTTRTPGDLTFGFYDLTTLGYVGDAGLGNFPQPGTTVGISGAPLANSTFNPVGGDVYFDNSYQTNPAYFSDFAHVAIHEIGHAIGLKHPFDVAPTGTSYTLASALDNGSETVMAYDGIRSPTLGPLDVGAVQYMYGSNTAAAHPFVQIWNPAAEAMTVIGNANAAQTLFGSGGNDTFYSLGANDALSGGEGNNTFYLSGRPATVNGGTGGNTVYTGLVYTSATLVTITGSLSGSIYLPASGGYETFYNVANLGFANGVYTPATRTFTPYSAAAYSATPTLIAAANSVLSIVSGTVNVGSVRGAAITVSGSATVNTVSGGVETIRLGTGPGVVYGNGQDTVFGGSGAATVLAGTGSDVVVGGAGALTYQAGSAANTVFGGTGTLTYIGGTGTDTVIAGGALPNTQPGAPATIIGGSGGGTYYGGGHGSIVAGVGAQAVMIGADGDTLYSAGSAGDLFGVASTGNVTMSGSNSAGNDVFFGGNGTGTLTFITGEGNDVMALGQGQNSVTLGAGTSTVFGNNGTTAVSTITAGTGSAAIGLGGRSVEVVVNAVAGGASRAIALYNFVPGADHVAAVGFAPSDVTAAIAAQTYSAGSTTVALPDHTLLTFIATTHVDARFFG